MFWSYIPLVTLGITAAAFVVKIPVEASEKICDIFAMTNLCDPGITHDRPSSLGTRVYGV